MPEKEKATCEICQKEKKVNKDDLCRKCYRDVIFLCDLREALEVFMIFILFSESLERQIEKIHE